MRKLLVLAIGGACLAAAQSAPAGQLTVAGRAVKLTNVYAYAAEGFFDKKKDDTVVLLTDRPVTEAQVRDGFALRRIAEQGKLAYVQETINAAGQIINFAIGHEAFKAPPSGGSTEHVFEGTADGRSVAGKVRTKGEQQFFGVKYEYEAKFTAAVQAKK